MESQNIGYTPYTMNEYIKKIVKLILNNSFSKVPIKRADIISNAIGGNAKYFNEAFSGARRILSDSYGLVIHEVPETKSSKLYIVASTIESTSILDYTEKQQGEITILFLVLSYIFMKGEPMNEEIVFVFLSKLKIPLDDPNENFSFVVKKLLTDTFVKQLYLKREKTQSVTSNETEFLFSWGYRAHVEFSKKSILNIVANILQKPTVCFVRQHSEILQLYGENMEVE